MKTFKELFGREPRVEVLHLVEKGENLDGFDFSAANVDRMTQCFTPKAQDMLDLSYVFGLEDVVKQVIVDTLVIACYPHVLDEWEASLDET